MDEAPSIAAKRPTAGFSLVELMVGLAIGLFIVATAFGLAAGQLRDDRSLVLESRVELALQTAADLIAHDLRRVGYRGVADVGIMRSSGTPVPNPYGELSWSASDSTLMLVFSHKDDAHEDQVVDSTDRFGYRMRDGVIDLKIGNSKWDPITDPSLLTVTAFSLTPVTQDIALGSSCDRPCPATDANCPRQRVTRYDLALAGRSATDASVTRSLSTSVRVRNDQVTGSCPV